MIVRYEYLWARRASGTDTADKDHPACIVASFRKTGSTEDMVVYLPISHTPPSGEEEGIELSTSSKRAAGLDERRQWVLVSECNVDTWPLDVNQLPNRPGRFHYGHLPPATFVSVRDKFSELHRAKKVRQVGRSMP